MKARDRWLNIRLTEAEHTAIATAARSAGRSISDYVRAMLVSDAPDDPEAAAFLATLQRLLGRMR